MCLLWLFLAGSRTVKRGDSPLRRKEFQFYLRLVIRRPRQYRYDVSYHNVIAAIIYHFLYICAH